MINGLMLAWSGFGGGTIGNTLAQWEQAGFFSYLLPFLLIFAVVFGVLTRSKIFGESNKGVGTIISLAVALMALQFDFVPVFFSEIFPRLGVGLAVILVAIILLGIFATKSQMGTFFWLGAVVGVVVLIKSFGASGWTSGVWFSDNWMNIILAVLILFGIIAVIGGGGSKEKGKQDSGEGSAFAHSYGG